MRYTEMISTVRAQLALDLNCRPDDLRLEGRVFARAADNPGRRPFPRGDRFFEMVAMGKSLVVCASSDIFAYVREELSGKTNDEAFDMPFVRGQSIYFLPDLDRLTPARIPPGVRIRLMEKTDIPRLYTLKGFRNAMQYDRRHPRPDTLVTTAEIDGAVVGIAGASADSEGMWQIGVDVLQGHRGGGIATALVSHLASEVLWRGVVPYYGTATSNITSQRVAVRAGLTPTWVSTYQGFFDGKLTTPTG